MSIMKRKLFRKLYICVLSIGLFVADTMTVSAKQVVFPNPVEETIEDNQVNSGERLTDYRNYSSKTDEMVDDTSDIVSTEAVISPREALNEYATGSGVFGIEKTKEEYLKAKEDAEGACWGYTNLGISNVSDNLNIRSIPEEDGRLVGKLPGNAACEILGTEGDWTHIVSGEVEGYVKSEYLLEGIQAKMRVREFLTEVVRVGTDGLNVRERPSTDAPIVTQVATGEILDYVETVDDWVAVLLDDETVYVSSEFVEVTLELDTALTMTEVRYGAGVSDIRADICNYALSYVGNPYVWGGVSLTKGADCSGFVLSVFKKYGFSMPHSSVSQSTMGTKISLGEAKAGDLVFYGNGKRINHVAIYLGNGQIVHASNPRTGIRVSNVHYRTPVKVVRMIND